MPGKDVNAMRARTLSPTPPVEEQEQEQQPEQQQGEPVPLTVAPVAPKRDKFAAQQARMQQQQQQQAQVEPSNATATASQPRRDKFAAQAARQQQQQATAAPRRDKFAAQAARQAGAAAAAAPKRDKFAALAQRPVEERNSSGISSKNSGVTTAVLTLQHPSQDSRIQQRRQRLIAERQAIWDDLEHAETCITSLLQEVAGHGLFDPDALRLSQKQSRLKSKQAKRNTREEKAQRKEQKRQERREAHHGMDPDDEDDDDDDDEEDDDETEESDDDDDDDTDDNSDAEENALHAPQPHERYSKMLQKLHSLCAPHAHWIQAYRPLSTTATAPATTIQQKKKKPSSDSKNSRITMYQARVEMRLAHEKRNICQEWLRLEQLEMEKLQKELDDDETKPKTEPKTEPGDGVQVKQENDESDSKKRKIEEVLQS
jgi:hypothetical protein